MRNKLTKKIVFKKKKINIPILILCFDRPDLLNKLLKVLKKYKITKIYISQDGCEGQNNPLIKKRHNEVRAIIKKLSNTNKIKTNFFKKNLGKQNGPPKGIDWFFKHVKRGVILEDDTIPSRTFFYFSKTLLKIHESDKKIFQICGSGTLSSEFGNITYLSSVPWMHGWATWRD